MYDDHDMLYSVEVVYK